jgi:hypothetical protein
MLVSLADLKTYLGVNPNPVTLNFNIDATARTLTRATGSWITAGVVVGNKLTLSGFSNPANNVQVTISVVTALVLTYQVQTPVLVTEVGNSLSAYRIDFTTDDAFLTQQGQLISDTIEAYCRRAFTSGAYVQTWYAEEWVRKNPREILPFHFPLITVTHLKVDGETADVSAYRVHKPTGIIKLLSDIRMDWDELELSYTAGYAAVPTPIQNAVYELVEARYNKKKAGVALNFGSDVQRVSIPGTISIDFDYSLQSNERSSQFGLILGNHLNVLDYYRSERVAFRIEELEYVT